jgi:hypothetical protein
LVGFGVRLGSRWRLFRLLDLRLDEQRGKCFSFGRRELAEIALSRLRR